MPRRKLLDRYRSIQTIQTINPIEVTKEDNEDHSITLYLPSGYYTNDPDQFMKTEKYKELKEKNPNLKVFSLNDCIIRVKNPDADK